MSFYTCVVVYLCATKSEFWKYLVISFELQVLQSRPALSKKGLQGHFCYSNPLKWSCLKSLDSLTNEMGLIGRHSLLRGTPSTVL